LVEQHTEIQWYICSRAALLFGVVLVAWWGKLVLGCG
jgi:hypothetical protein